MMEGVMWRTGVEQFLYVLVSSLFSKYVNYSTKVLQLYLKLYSALTFSL